MLRLIRVLLGRRLGYVLEGLLPGLIDRGSSSCLVAGAREHRGGSVSAGSSFFATLAGGSVDGVGLSCRAAHVPLHCSGCECAWVEDRSDHLSAGYANDGRGLAISSFVPVEAGMCSGRRRERKWSSADRAAGPGCLVARRGPFGRGIGPIRGLVRIADVLRRGWNWIRPSLALERLAVADRPDTTTRTYVVSNFLRIEVVLRRGRAKLPRLGGTRRVTCDPLEWTCVVATAHAGPSNQPIGGLVHRIDGLCRGRRPLPPRGRPLERGEVVGRPRSPCRWHHGRVVRLDEELRRSVR